MSCNKNCSCCSSGYESGGDCPKPCNACTPPTCSPPPCVPNPCLMGPSGRWPVPMPSVPVIDELLLRCADIKKRCTPVALQAQNKLNIQEAKLKKEEDIVSVCFVKFPKCSITVPDLWIFAQRLSSFAVTLRMLGSSPEDQGLSFVNFSIANA